jgi:putative methyltransferase (TIGR04325 family)
MREPVAEIIGRCKKPPRHLIINRPPAYDGEEYWTVQNLGINKVPYRIHSRPQLIESIQNLGCRLRDAWPKPRQVVIPVPFEFVRVLSPFSRFCCHRSPRYGILTP